MVPKQHVLLCITCLPIMSAFYNKIKKQGHIGRSKLLEMDKMTSKKIILVLRVPIGPAYFVKLRQKIPFADAIAQNKF